VAWPRESFDRWWADASDALPTSVAATRATYAVAAPAATACEVDTWRATTTWMEPRSSATSVWTGTEMIVWGGPGRLGGLLEHRRTVQPGYRHVDRDKSWRERPSRAFRPHSGVDRHQDDRLGGRRVRTISTRVAVTIRLRFVAKSHPPSRMSLRSGAAIRRCGPVRR
jgi:hypothetical protein